MPSPRLLFAIATTLFAVGCAHAPGAGRGDDAALATATLIGTTGTSVGTAAFFAAGAGVRVELNIVGLSDGPHGVHLHAVGSCVGPAFASAGPHINPSGAKHGVKNPGGPHAGDMPNVIITGGRSIGYTTTTLRVTLTDGANGLFDADGSAIVVHAAADDDLTDPSGSSGARVACGVITRR